MIEIFKYFLYFKYNSTKMEKQINTQEIVYRKYNKSLISIRKRNNLLNLIFRDNNKFKKKIYITNNNIKKSFIYFHFYIIIYIAFLIVINSEKRDISYSRKLVLSNSIILTIKGTGYQSILNPYFATDPDSITLNDEVVILESHFAININTDSEINYVILQWNSDITNRCEEMFGGLTNLIEINLYNFEFPELAVLDKMFINCENLEKITFGNNVEPYLINGINSMFYGCKSLKSLDLSIFDVSQVTNMGFVFSGCSSLTSINLSNFNTINASFMKGMFSDCIMLESLDLSKFDTSQVTDMSYMFRNCSSLISLNLSNFYTSQVTDMEFMFSCCSSLKSLDISLIDTSNVLNFGYMFSDCLSLKSIDLSNFNGEKVLNFGFMFSGCSSLESLDLSNFHSSSSSNMGNMFKDCTSLKSVDLSNIHTNNVTNLGDMFSGCSSLTSLDLSGFNTSLVTNMGNMFYNCSSLSSLDISNFDTSLVINMGNLFYGCSSITSLDLSFFNTASLANLNSMFEECNKLKYLDISNFDISRINTIVSVFKGCYNLDYIKFKNFVENLQSVYNSFDDIPGNVIFCTNSEINMPKITEVLNNKIGAVNSCSDDWIKNKTIIIPDKNIVVNSCSEDETYQYLYNYKCYLECPENTNQIIIDDEKICIINCLNSDLPFVKNEECIESCSSLDFFEKICIISNDNLENKEYIINVINDEISSLINKDLIINYKHETYQIGTTGSQKNNEMNNYTAIYLGECEEKLKKEHNINEDVELTIFKMDYYLNEFLIPITEYKIFSPLTYKPIDLSFCQGINIYITKPVNINENELYKYNPYSNYYNNSCFLGSSSMDCENKEILNERKIEFNNNKLSLCEKICTYIDYNITSKRVKCKCEVKSSFSLLSELYYNKNNLIFNFEINDIISAIDSLKNATNISKKEALKMLDEYFKDISIPDNISLESLIKDFISSGEKNYVLKKEEFSFQILPYDKQNKSDDLSVINLGECEEKLKEKYGIDQQESLIIVKIDLQETGYLIPKVEYSVYNPIKLEKLELDICNDTKIDIMVPVQINKEDLFKYNTSSDYYKDLCFPYTTKEGTDISLDDRKNEYVDNNMSLCENNCEYTGYNDEAKKAICKCDVKTKFVLISEIKINKQEILKNFIDIKNRINLSTMKCYKLVFSKKGQIKNIGSYVLLLIFLIDLILAIFFKFKGLAFLSNRINYIKAMLESNNNMNKNKSGINNNNKKKESKKDKKLKKGYNISKNIKKKGIAITDTKNNNNPMKKKLKLNSSEQYFSSGNLADLKLIKINGNKKNKLNNISIFSKNSLNPEKPDNLKMKYQYNEYEINNLSYKEAKLLDKRTYFQYYISLIKRKQLVIFAFYTNTDYNSRLLKIMLFLFSFSLYLTINALFFNDSTVHKIYEDKGSFNFLYNLPKILYSTIISSLINYVVLFLSLTEKDIIKIKVNVKDKKQDLNKVVLATEKCLKLKIIFFFLFNFIFIMFFWYYLSSFSAVYTNTQFHLFKDVTISFLISLLYPFGLSLLPGIFRIPSLRDKNNNRKCLYDISKLVQLI